MSGRNLRMTEEAYAARMKRNSAVSIIEDTAAYLVPKTPKYRNVKTDGFDSKREAKRYAELETMQKAGQIAQLERQVKFELLPSQKREDGTTERAVTYTVDFAYWQDGKRVYEDTKGIRTQQGIIRRKLMLFIHGITVREV